MFYVSSVKNNLIGIVDTYDNVEEFYTVNQVKEISKQVKINGVSSRGIKKIDLGEALLTREIVEKIDCKKALFFEIVNDLAKYKLLGKDEIISDDFILLETDTELKLISDKIIMLDDERNIVGLFEGTNFNRVDFHNTNTSNVRDMSFMFYGCQATSLDISSFNTYRVTNMMNMFRCCEVTSLNLINFNTSNVTNMMGMFKGCQATSLNLINFNTSNVKNMSAMFKDCQATSLDLSGFDTSNVSNMEDIFSGCQATSLNLSNFDTFNVTSMDCLFSDYKGSIKTTDDRLLKVYNERRLI